MNEFACVCGGGGGMSLRVCVGGVRVCGFSRLV